MAHPASSLRWGGSAVAVPLRDRAILAEVFRFACVRARGAGSGLDLVSAAGVLGSVAPRRGWPWLSFRCFAGVVRCPPSLIGWVRVVVLGMRFEERN